MIVVDLEPEDLMLIRLEGHVFQVLAFVDVLVVSRLDGPIDVATFWDPA